ncbi:MAG: SH3 domain-containing protein, partial [Flavobacteriaceae bacterium]
KSEPNLKSETVFILHEGAKIQILESYKKEWSKIKLIDGKSGWLPNEAFKEL